MATTILGVVRVEAGPSADLPREQVTPRLPRTKEVSKMPDSQFETRKVLDEPGHVGHLAAKA